MNRGISTDSLKPKRHTVQRAQLTEDRIHPAIRDRIAGLHRDLITEVESALEAHRVVIIGLGGNPHVGKAKKLLAARGIDFEYLQFGSYLSNWRRRNALKMWTGWPTFPMVFVDKALIGGASDLKALAESGGLDGLVKG
ncbi:MAG: monothiol glutaredoxin [Bradymonadia bacterium]